MKLIIALILITLILSGCRKPDKVLPKIYKNYSGNYAENLKYYGVELTWEY